MLGLICIYTRTNEWRKESIMARERETWGLKY